MPKTKVSHRDRSVKGPYHEWYINNYWVKFRILRELEGDGGHTNIPEGAVLIGHAVHDDHLEELYQLGDQYFRHAGGGRGFYWTQELELVWEDTTKPFTSEEN